tara:strand:+ start:1279 stop:1458 length:180 start_codon:yes stop_codon:yes gene_type:complete
MESIMRVGDLVQYKDIPACPLMGIITRLWIDWDGDWAEVTWTDGRDSMEKINGLEAVCE